MTDLAVQAFMTSLLTMLKSCGLGIPANASSNAPDLPRIVWHNANTNFPGETLLAARGAAQQKFGAEPDIIFACLPTQDKELYQEVCMQFDGCHACRSALIQAFTEAMVTIRGSLLYQKLHARLLQHLCPVADGWIRQA